MTDWKPGIDKNNVPYAELDITGYFHDIVDMDDCEYPEYFKATIRKYPRNYNLAFTYEKDILEDYESDHDYPTPMPVIEIWRLWKKIPHAEFNLDKAIKEFRIFIATYLDREYCL